MILRFLNVSIFRSLPHSVVEPFSFVGFFKEQLPEGFRALDPIFGGVGATPVSRVRSHRLVPIYIRRPAIYVNNTVFFALIGSPIVIQQ